DQVLPVCDGTYKILRTWTALDWCLPTQPGINPRTHIQLVKVIDDAGPEIACPDDLTVSTNPNDCEGDINLPDVIVSDECSQIASVVAQWGTGSISGTLTTFPGNNLWNPDTLAVLGVAHNLPLGTTEVTYTVTDDCGNTSTCVFNLTVEDGTPPTVACDEWTQVSLGVDGMVLVNAKTFDDGSYDNCSDIFFKVRRMDENPCQPNNKFYDQVKFCCSDLGDTITVILRVYDVPVPAGEVELDYEDYHSNDCMVRVLVDDKLKPTCQAPANTTVSCKNFDPSLWAYGMATGTDNCCLDTIIATANYSQFDTFCNRGTITRSFRVLDCGGQSNTCTQRVFVNYQQDYFVKFPDDRLLTVCDGTGNYGEPLFSGKDCELLGVSHTDEIFTVVPDACYKIERTWNVINWCRYNANQPLTVVPNPNPNATVNSPANNPGAVISSSSNPNVVAAPWTATRLAIVPGATPTDYSVFYNGGTYTFNGQTITVPGIDQGNGFSYKQIIKVVDQQKPSFDNCPSSPVNFCDLTANSSTLWNESYWWDAGISSHDLCEGPADLSITGTDACSGANVNIRYLLFLDLDKDGTMETVVSSTNLPGFNQVFYNNASNPAFTGGIPQAFDERPVPANQKYGFALQTTVNGNKKTAAVRWNTFAAPTQYIVPELPYGTHKIKWIIEDGCGNEQVCEYTFVVKDCKAPTVVCQNGLSVNIMPTGMITLWASDFLKYMEDNCTPSNKLVLGIRKAGTGTGFPLDAQNNPITSVTFTCTDLGKQEVELWAMDLAGNSDFCQTYLIVQDNNGNCPNNGPNAAVAGYLKTEEQQGLEGAQVDLQVQSAVSAPVSMSRITTEEGRFYFANAVPAEGDYTLTPQKDENPLNGVSTYDLVLISKHILGLEPLSSPYKMIAADANKSGSITTFDIVELRKLILGIYTELPNNTSWRFVEKGYAFPDPSNPFKVNFPENTSKVGVQASQMYDDFVAIKVGDLNASVQANSLVANEDRTDGTLFFDVADRQVQAGEMVDVAFQSAEQVQGFQMTLALAGLTVEEVLSASRVGADNFGLFSDALTVSIDGADEFTVRFRAQRSGRLSEMLTASSHITKAEAYAAATKMGVALRFQGAGGMATSGQQFALYQNTPNPVQGSTQIAFNLPVASEAVLTVTDAEGRVLKVVSGQYAKGLNVVTLQRSDLASGMLFYQLSTPTHTATLKMVVTD
ncbi:MAG TPA: T9SS type A sorting domain-containing protein, partial [Saprospiraceae bacterium]|nr:T9SS type A sorting domain-containing protein [Saprospiraceae bacterium]